MHHTAPAPAAPREGHARIPRFLQEVTALAVAVLDRDGRVLEANRGFLYLAGVERAPAPGWEAGALFLNPSFRALVDARPDDRGCLFRGVVTLGSEQSARSLSASVHCSGTDLLFAGEHDVAELERLAATAVQLNDELTVTQRELTRRNRELQHQEARLKSLTLTDPLTELPNRRHFERRLTEAVERLERRGPPLSVAIADADHFKRINDTHGHKAGDTVLQALARLLCDNLRGTDFVARWGGEEFALLLSADLACAEAVLERLRAALATSPPEPLEEPVTMSFGVAEVTRGEDPVEALRRADRALYRAKAAGRNRVVAAGIDNPESA